MREIKHMYHSTSEQPYRMFKQYSSNALILLENMYASSALIIPFKLFSEAVFCCRSLFTPNHSASENHKKRGHGLSTNALLYFLPYSENPCVGGAELGNAQKQRNDLACRF